MRTRAAITTSRLTTVVLGLALGPACGGESDGRRDPSESNGIASVGGGETTGTGTGTTTEPSDTTGSGGGSGSGDTTMGNAPVFDVGTDDDDCINLECQQVDSPRA